MPIFELSNTWMIVLDIIAWFIFHLTISMMALKMPRIFFTKHTGLYQTQVWERGGQIWQQIFRVKSWKNLIPDGTIFLKKGYSKKQLHSMDEVGLEQFLIESRRAEWTHWLSILPAPIFFLWNPVWVGWVMIIYAVSFNLPIIIVQRYNRPRLEKLIRLRQVAR